MAPVFFLATLFASLAASASAIANIRCTPVTGQKMDVSWTSDSSDSSPMSLALMSAAEDSRNPGGLVLADNVSPHDQSITVHLPTVEPGAYIISLISTPKRARAPGPILGSSSPFHILARQDSSSSSGSGSSSSSSTLPPLSKSSSKLSASLSAIESSLSAAESSQLSSASSAFSAGASNISSAVSMHSSVSAAQSSATSSSTGSGSAAVAVRLVGSGVGAALVAVLGGVAVGAALL